MSERKDERLGIGSDPGRPSLKMPLSSIKSVIQMLKYALQTSDIPLPFISAEQIEIGVKFRRGISKIDTVSRVINKKAGIGINIGPNNDGSENKSNAKDRILIEEILDEIMYKSKVEVVIPKGGLLLNTPKDIVLANGAGPVVGTISNVTRPIKAEGIIR